MYAFCKQQKQALPRFLVARASRGGNVARKPWAEASSSLKLEAAEKRLLVRRSPGPRAVEAGFILELGQQCYTQNNRSPLI